MAWAARFDARLTAQMRQAAWLGLRVSTRGSPRKWNRQRCWAWARWRSCVRRDRGMRNTCFLRAHDGFSNVSYADGAHFALGRRRAPYRAMEAGGAAWDARFGARHCAKGAGGVAAGRGRAGEAVREGIGESAIRVFRATMTVFQTCHTLAARVLPEDGDARLTAQRGRVARLGLRVLTRGLPRKGDGWRGLDCAF